MLTNARLVLTIALAALSAAAPAAQFETVSGSQRRAALEFLAAVSSGGAEGLAQVLTARELDALRNELMTALKAESLRGGSNLRSRLFGSATSMTMLERQTSQSFFTSLARRITLEARFVEDPEWLVAIRDGEGRAIVVVRGKTRDEREAPATVQTIELVADGKDWKAALPSEVRVQIDELMRGRQPARVNNTPVASGATPGPLGAGAATGATGSASRTLSAPPEVLSMLYSAERTLADGNCERYYKEYMSPGFRRTQSAKALDTLINACKRSLATRELLVAALRIARQLTPQMESDGARAVYDVSDQGLPFERFTVEMIDKRWYVAE